MTGPSLPIPTATSEPPLPEPYATYAQLRRDAPVAFQPAHNLWMVTRHQDICTVLADPVSFSSRNANQFDLAFSDEVLAVLATGYMDLSPALVDNDPPAHTRIRRLVSGAFSPRRMAVLEPAIRTVATGLIDAIEPAGQMDLIADFAVPLPLLIIADLLGIPRADIFAVKRWCDDWLALSSGGAAPDQAVASAEGFVAFQRYVVALLEKRRAQPQDDMLSDLLMAQSNDELPLQLPELISLTLQLMFAGHATTSHATGNLVYLLLSEPSRWQALVDDPQLIPNAVEESLRFESPVPGILRTTTTEVELGGVRLPKGARLQIVYASGNRDPQQFPHADVFRLDRANPERHLAFGRGIHFCVGAGLARLEVRIALEVLTQRLPGLALANTDALQYIPSPFIRGLMQLPVRWEHSTNK